MVADYIPDNASLFINIGTTTEEVAKALRDHKNLRVITNNLNVASLLCDNPNFEVIVAGGVVRTDRGVIGESPSISSGSSRSTTASSAFQGSTATGRCWISITAKSGRAGYHRNARQIILVTDHTKFGCNPMVRLCHISDIDVLFTDRQPPENILAELSKANVGVHVSDPIEETFPQ